MLTETNKGAQSYLRCLLLLLLSRRPVVDERDAEENARDSGAPREAPRLAEEDAPEGARGDEVRAGVDDHRLRRRRRALHGPDVEEPHRRGQRGEEAEEQQLRRLSGLVGECEPEGDAAGARAKARHDGFEQHLELKCGKIRDTKRLFKNFHSFQFTTEFCNFPGRTKFAQNGAWNQISAVSEVRFRLRNLRISSFGIYYSDSFLVQKPCFRMKSAV